MDSKINVAIVLHGLGANGIDTLFANLSEFWDYDKLNLTYLLAVDTDSEQMWEEKVTKNGCRVVHLHDLDRKRILMWPISLYKAFRKYGPFDAVHVNMDMLNGINLTVARLAGITIRLCHSHVTKSQYDVKKGINVVSILYRLIMRVMIWFNSSIRCGCSEAAMNYLYGKHWKKDKKSFVIDNGIDIQKFKEETDKRQKMDELGIDACYRYIMTVGRITSAKNVFFILDIMHEIKNQNLPYKLIWCGKGDLEYEVSERIKKEQLEDYIIMLGIRNDIHEILKCCDLFLLPSLFEGLGIVLIEAQASGLVCIASDQVPEKVDCGLCQFLSLERGAKYWCDKIRLELEKDLQRDLQIKRLNNFEIRKMNLKLERIYCGLV